jgi:4-alpha-glucanotransferase
LLPARIAERAATEREESMLETVSRDGSVTVPAPDPAITEALRLLGKRRVALAIHDSCLPGLPTDDIGRGALYSRGAMQFLSFIRGLGFDTIQLGPLGQTPRDDPSPYHGTVFSRNVLNLDLGRLAVEGERAGLQEGLLDPEVVERWVRGSPCQDGSRSVHGYAFDAAHHMLDEIHRNFVAARQRRDPRVLEADADLRLFSDRNRGWLEPDALYHVLWRRHGGRHHRDWSVTDSVCPDAALYRHSGHPSDPCRSRRQALFETHRDAIDRYRLGQFLVQRQHAVFRADAKRLGLRIYGDLQVGLSACDEWSRSALLLADYHMGAPPSRTNRDGQPWGYGVYDPDQYFDAQGAPGPVLRFLRARIEVMLGEVDGLRIDHPHGFVCPWVYRADDPDPYHAVQHGARLFSSPQLADHPGLARFAIAEPEQLNEGVPRHSDDWVRWLRADQVERYAMLLDTVVNVVKECGGSSEDIPCEVLSTLPYPVARVIGRQGLGRFRVTQKADPRNRDDVYRSENADARDWIMVGTHDTPPFWDLARRWVEEGDRARMEAEDLAARLVPARERERFAREVSGDRNKLVHAKWADVFASPAEKVMVFFADLLGEERTYNRAGFVTSDNWTLRVRRDYATAFPSAAARGDALNLPCVLALAMRGRGEDFARNHHALIQRLRQQAGWWPAAGGT